MKEEHNMEARAILRYARISPRKVSFVLDLIRNQPVDLSLIHIYGVSLVSPPRAQLWGYDPDNNS